MTLNNFFNLVCPNLSHPVTFFNKMCKLLGSCYVLLKPFEQKDPIFPLPGSAGTYSV